jgi:hypothetical protein
MCYQLTLGEYADMFRYRLSAGIEVVGEGGWRHGLRRY